MPSYPTGQTIGGNMSVTDTISGLLGELRFTNTGTFRYGKAGAALTAGDLCAFSTDGAYTATKQAAPGAATFALGVPQVDIASGSYGWFFVGDGTFSVNTAAGVASAAKLTTTATPGQVGAGGVLFGAVAAAASGAGGVTAAFAPGRLGVNLYA